MLQQPELFVTTLKLGFSCRPSTNSYEQAHMQKSHELARMYYLPRKISKKRRKNAHNKQKMSKKVAKHQESA